MIIKNMEGLSLDAIAKLFNRAFADYIVPVNLTSAALAKKCKRDNVILKYSFAAFEGGAPTGFILHGFKEDGPQKYLYNAGTGVVPDARGSGLTSKIYKHLLPLAEKDGINKIFLEVISTNTPALKTYGKCGFKIIRELPCRKGAVSDALKGGDFAVNEIKNINWPLLKSFWDFAPSWQNDINAVINIWDDFKPLGIYEGDTLSGYGLYSAGSKSLAQIAVSKNCRKKGAASALLKHIAANYSPELSLVNTDASSAALEAFLNKAGLKEYLRQYEMVLTL